MRILHHIYRALWSNQNINLFPHFQTNLCHGIPMISSALLQTSFSLELFVCKDIRELHMNCITPDYLLVLGRAFHRVLMALPVLLCCCPAQGRCEWQFLSQRPIIINLWEFCFVVVGKKKNWKGWMFQNCRNWLIFSLLYLFCCHCKLIHKRQELREILTKNRSHLDFLKCFAVRRWHRHNPGYIFNSTWVHHIKVLASKMWSFTWSRELGHLKPLQTEGKYWSKMILLTLTNFYLNT